MAIIKVRVKINGVWTNLSKNSSTGKWSGTLTAPAATSYPLSGGYYPVTIEATNDAGTVKIWEDTDAAWGSTLKLVVKETIKPIITLLTPSDGSYVTNNKQSISFQITDEVGGSGVNLSEVRLKIDNKSYLYNSTGMTYRAIRNGYEFTYLPTTAFADGSHSIEIQAKDNDGNAAEKIIATFMVDTVPPSLIVSAPAAGLITNQPSLTIKGNSNDVTSSPVTISVLLNGSDQGEVSIETGGSFSKNILLAEGSNTITITAVDAAGKSTTLSRTVKLDTSIPKIQSLALTPNPANTSASLILTVEVV